jgi:hypothetical protein
MEALTVKSFPHLISRRPACYQNDQLAQAISTLPTPLDMVSKEEGFGGGRGGSKRSKTRKNHYQPSISSKYQ